MVNDRHWKEEWDHWFESQFPRLRSREKSRSTDREPGSCPAGRWGCECKQWGACGKGENMPSPWQSNSMKVRQKAESNLKILSRPNKTQLWGAAAHGPLCRVHSAHCPWGCQAPRAASAALAPCSWDSGGSPGHDVHSPGWVLTHRGSWTNNTVCLFCELQNWAISLIR